MTAVEALIAHALTWVGYTEGPASNQTPFGARLSHQFQPWCDAFISCMAQDVQLTDVIPASVYVPGRLATARAAGQVVSVPHRGDLAAYDWPPQDGVPDHIGIVLTVDGRTLTTLEGNTSPDDGGSQGNGGGVYIRHRDISLVLAFIRPPYPTGDWPMADPLTAEQTEAAIWQAAYPTSAGHTELAQDRLLQAARGTNVLPAIAALGARVDALTAAVTALGAKGTPVILEQAQIDALGAAVAAKVPAADASVLAQAIAAEFGKLLGAS